MDFGLWEGLGPLQRRRQGGSRRCPTHELQTWNECVHPWLVDTYRPRPPRHHLSPELAGDGELCHALQAERTRLLGVVVPLRVDGS